MKNYLQKSIILIIFLVLALFVGGSLTLVPSSETLSANQSDSFTRTIVLNNTNSSADVNITLPTSILFAGNQENHTITFSYNATSPVLLLNGTNATINYSFSVPSSIFNDTYNARVNFTTNNSQFSLLDIELLILGVDSATLTDTSISLIQGFNGNTTVVLNNTGNTNFKTLNFTLTDLVDTSNASNSFNGTNVTLPGNFEVNFTQSSNQTLQFFVPEDQRAGTYSGNLSVNGVTANSTVTLTVAEAVSSASIANPTITGVQGLTNNGSVIITNTGNLDLTTLNLSVTNLTLTGNSSIIYDAVNITLPGNFDINTTTTLSNQTLTFNIPTSQDNGTYTGNLTLNGVTANATLTLVVEEPSPAITFSSSPFDFGKTNVNSTKTQSLIITNSGNAEMTNLVLQNLDIASQFNVTIGNNDTSNLSAGASNTYSVTLTFPASESTGVRTLGSLQASSDQVNATVSVKVNLEGRLVIDKVEVDVDGSRDNDVQDGNTISKKAEPGDEVEFEVTVRNKFTSSEDVDIEDVVITITIEDIDDGDDLEEETKEFDVEANEDETETLTFDIPEDAEEDEYDVLIEVEGEDTEGNDHEIEFRTKLRVDRDKHKLILSRVDLESNILTCRKNNVLSVTALNVGSTDEKDSVLTIKSPELGLDFKEEFELEEDPDDEDSTFSKNFQFTVPENVVPGDYPIEAKLYYDTTNVVDIEATVLKISACPTTTPQPTTTTTTTSPETGEVTVIQPTTTGSGSQVATVPSTFTAVGEDFSESRSYTGLLIVANLFVVTLVGVLFFQLFRRP